MQDEMTRGRSQVIWRYLPGATFRYNDDNAWCIVTDVAMSETRTLDGVLADAVADRLAYWDAIGTTGYPDPRSQPHKYVVGEPYWVRYDIWPTIFICGKCHKMHYWGSVKKLKASNDRLRCSYCGKTDEVLKQVSFAYVCECGRIDTVFVPKCPSDNQHPVGLVDKQSFQDSYWYCQTCRQRIPQGSRAGLGVRACGCGKTMRGVTLIDPRVYYSQTIAMVDIRLDILDVWKQNERFADFLLGASFRIACYDRLDILDLSKVFPQSDTLSPELQKMKNMLLAQGMSLLQVEKMIGEAAKSTSSGPWDEYFEQLKQCRQVLPGFVPSECRQTVEYIFVRDEPSIVSIPFNSLISEAASKGDSQSKERLIADRELCESLGIINLAIVQELPIQLAGIGYSRYSSSPVDFDGSASKAKLNPYPVSDSNKIPLYVARNTTEALLYELDPWRIAAFLRANEITHLPEEALSSESMLRAWLLGVCSHLRTVGQSHLVLLDCEMERGEAVDLTSAMVFGVLHTISHLLMATAHRYVGIDQDALSEYLFPAHVSGLLYASSHVAFTLGGIDAVVRGNLTQWIGTARDYAGNCPFDPVCGDAGGACLACLYTKFGCSYFNRTLSRAFLFGGRINGYDKRLDGYWSHRVSEDAARLREKHAIK